MEENGSKKSADNMKDGQRFYLADTGYQFIMSLSGDEMECMGHLERKLSGDNISAGKIREFMAANGISTGIDDAAIDDFVNSIQPGKSSNSILARGEQPKRGDDGRLEYKVEVEGAQQKTATEGEEGEKVDFRSVQKFINVDPDQNIAVVIPPTAGKPGSTVKGRSVPPEAGVPLIIKPGKNVRISGDTIISEIHGRVKIEDDIINVVEEYQVDGDVDFSVGNIRFNGYVEIKGDVLDGFQVNASKGIKIGGNVGASRLVSHGNIEICGMDGQGVGSILCGGSLTANFIHTSVLEVWGPMNVNVELRDTSVHCRGPVHAGIISGGDCIALGGIDSKQLGSPSGIRTRLHAGADYRDLQRIEELILQIEKVIERTERAKDLTELEELHKQRKQLAASVVEVRNRHQPGANPKINVHSKLFEGVVVTLGNSTEEFSSQHTGPLTLIENSREGGLRNIPLTPLDIHASVIEKGWLERLDQEKADKELEEHLKLEQDKTDEEVMPSSEGMKDSSN